MLTFRAAIEDLGKADEKKSHAEVGYQYQPNGEEQCALCSMYQAVGKCSAVADPIEPDGWCRIFKWWTAKRDVKDIAGAPIESPSNHDPEEGHTRVMEAMTGDPLIDAALQGPITQRNINNPIVSRSYDVPYGAGGSEPLEDPTTFIDRHVPRRMQVGDIFFDPADPYVIHENIEQTIMEKLTAAGMDPEAAYKVAHYEFAEKAEGAWYAHHGIDRSEAERQEDVFLREIQHETPENPPPNLYEKPYPHHDIWMARHEQFKESYPTASEIAQARAILDPIYLGKPYGKRVAKTLYVRRDVLNADDIRKWMLSQGFETTLDPGDMHVTVAYSRAKMFWPEAQENRIKISGGSRSIHKFGDDFSATVMKIESPELSVRHQEFLRKGASWDWPDYHPHITISYDGPEDIDSVEPLEGDIILGPEIFEEVQEGWKDNIAEKKDDVSDLRAAVYAYLMKQDPKVAALMVPEVAAREATLKDEVMEMPQTTDSESVQRWLERMFKTQPTASDVHATTALGNEGRKKRKAKDFISTIAEAKGKHVGENGVEKQDVEWEAEIRVTKTDEERQLVFGWASVTHVDGELVIDKQDDIITSDELEKAAYDFVLYCREQGDMHERVGVGRLVESCVFTQEKMEKCGLLAVDPDSGSQMYGWFCGFRVEAPDVWKRIKAGALPEFSIGGRAVRVPA